MKAVTITPAPVTAVTLRINPSSLKFPGPYVRTTGALSASFRNTTLTVAVAVEAGTNISSLFA